MFIKQFKNEFEIVKNENNVNFGEKQKHEKAKTFLQKLEC